MRAIFVALLFFALCSPTLAQTALKSEPLALAPYEVAFVRDGRCLAGQILKVTGAIRGLHRKRMCVADAGAQAALSETSIY